MSRLRDRILSDDPLIRAMSYQSVLSAFGEGVFITGSAVYFTQVVGLSAARVGLGLTIAMAFQFALSVPLGKAADRVGTKLTWVLGSGLEAVFFGSWFLVRGFGAYVVVTVALELAQTWMRAGRNAYRLDVFPRDQRVRSLAYMRAARNVGFTLGALGGGIALAFDSIALIKAVPLFTACVLVVNMVLVIRLPRAAHAHIPASPLQDAAEHAGGSRSALRNRGFVATCVLDGVLSTHQVLLNVVIPLWLVQETNAPKVLLAWLFGTNTVMAVALQVAAARGVTDVGSSLRAQRRAAACFVLSCGVISVTDSTTEWLTIALVWLAHVTVTGAELFNSAGEWGLVAELSDPARRGEYQGAQELGLTLGTVWAPAAYTYLATSWGIAGWALIAGVICLATVLMPPAARSAERFLARGVPLS